MLLLDIPRLFPPGCERIGPSLQTLGSDEDQERRERLPLLAKEQSWRTPWRARSLLGWTNPDSGTTITGLRAPTVAMRDR
jgi:hypothetical protein